MTFAPHHVHDATDDWPLDRAALEALPPSDAEDYATRRGEIIDYAGRRIWCPVSIHPRLREIKIALANGESHETIGDRYGLPHAYPIENEHNGELSRGEFVRRFKVRHPEVAAGRPAA